MAQSTNPEQVLQSTSTTQHSPDDWNGTRGVRWLAHHEWLDGCFSAFGRAAMLAAHLRPGERVLDVGCGTGATTLELFRQVQPGGKVLGVDISEPLIQGARERARVQNAPIDFEIGDAGSHSVVPGTFDVLFSRFGVMFFREPARAFAHLRTALAPGGRAAFICWRTAAENEWFHVPALALRDVLPPGPPVDPHAPGPFAFGDRHRVESILHQGGFSEIAITPFDAPLYVAADADESLDQSLRVGAFIDMLAKQPEDLRQRGRAAMRAALAAHGTPSGVSLAGAAWIVTARV